MDLLHAVSKVLLRHASKERFKALRSRYLGARKALGGLTRRLYGSFGTDELRDHLESRIGRDFEILMVHSSVNHMEPMYQGNALELVRMLIDYCGPERTLVMPAFFFGDPKVGNVHQTFSRDSRFDLRRTPSQMGLVTELFRRHRGVLQSRHPVYRISAFGPLARELTAGHEQAQSAAGPGSPFDTMSHRDTLILGIGKSYDVITQVHAVDHIVKEAIPGLAKHREDGAGLTVTLVDGAHEIPVVLRGSAVVGRLNMRRLPSLLHRADMDLWRFHGMPLFAVRAAILSDRLIEAARRGLSLYETR